MGHDHDHHGHGHHHHHGDADGKRLAVALGLTLLLVVAEVVAGVLADSLALLSDAAHNVTDAAAIGLALAAGRFAARPAGGRFTFGLGRAEVLSAQVNGASLLVLAGLIAADAVRRFADPGSVDGGIVVVTGVLGAVANGAVFLVLAGSARKALHVEGAMQHVLADLWSSVAAVVAGAIVLFGGPDQVDPAAALLVAFLMLRSAWSLLRDSGRILLEGAPAGVDPNAVGMAMARMSGVVEVHDLHVWEVTTGFDTLVAHVLVGSGEDCHTIRRDMEKMLRTDYGIGHTTLQVDHAPRGGIIQLQPRP